MEKQDQEIYERLAEGVRQGDEYDMLRMALCELIGIGTEQDTATAMDRLYTLAEQSEEYEQDDTIIIEPRLFAYHLSAMLHKLLPRDAVFHNEPLIIVEESKD